jgi:imidazolonepropionase-like amidohydrolase
MSEREPAAASGLTLFTNANVVDPAEGDVRADARVLVDGDRILEVGGPDLRADSAQTVDVAGRFLMPGLVDAHVHVTAATADVTAQADWSSSYVTAHAARIMAGMLDRGFTTVRDVAGADFGLAAAVDEGLLIGPRLVFGGKALSQTGGHGDPRPAGRHVLDDHPCAATLSLVVDGVDEVRRGARAQLRTGAHHVKIMLSGGVASLTDRVDSVQFSEDEITAVVQEAAAAHRYVTGHAYTAEAINRGLRLGVRCIEHGNLLDQTSLDLFLSNDAYLVPTLVTYERLAAEGPAQGLPAASAAKVEDVLDAGLGALEAAHRAGVNVAFGTDLLGGMHRAQAEEFRIRAQVQPSVDVLRAATCNAARLMGMEGRIGVVAPGAEADLLVVDRNPLDDVTVLARPEQHLRLVMTRGRVHTTRLD